MSAQTAQVTPTEKTGRRKTITGIVVASNMAKTVTVEVSRLMRHPKYGKYFKVSKKYKVHDEKKECGVGDSIEMIESRPISKTKRFRVLRIVEKAKTNALIEAEV